MDKLDYYGDNFRNVPICVPNETEKDAQTFKEKNSKSPETHCSSQTSCLPATDNSDKSNSSNWSGDYIWNNLRISESGDVENTPVFLTNLSYGHKNKTKKEKKDSKR